MNKTFKYLGDKCHLLSEVNDGDRTIILYKVWRKTKRRWSYRAETEWLIKASIRMWNKMS